MRLLEGFNLFGISRVNPNAPGFVESLRREQIAAAHLLGWTLNVAARPVTMSFPPMDESHPKPALIETVEDTGLGMRALRGALTITECYLDADGNLMPDSKDDPGVVARVDLNIHGVVPPLGLRGVILDCVCVATGEPVFREVPHSYDPGRYREAGLPPIQPLPSA